MIFITLSEPFDLLGLLTLSRRIGPLDRFGGTIGGTTAQNLGVTLAPDYLYRCINRLVPGTLLLAYWEISRSAASYPLYSEDHYLSFLISKGCLLTDTASGRLILNPLAHGSIETRGERGDNLLDEIDRGNRMQGTMRPQ